LIPARGRGKEEGPRTGGDTLAGVAGTLAGLITTARGGGLDDTAALFALVAGRRRAAELDDSELALIETARGGTPEAAATA
jgi:hypothetical protein